MSTSLVRCITGGRIGPSGLARPIWKPRRSGYGFRSLRPLTSTTKKIRYIASAKLSDGTVVKIIEHPRNPNRTAFAVARGKSRFLANRIHAEREVLVPFPRQHAFVRGLFLPCGLEEYGSVVDLKSRIGDFLNARYPLSDDLQDLFSEFVVGTYTYEYRSFSPLMILAAPLSISHPLIEALSEVCMRALRVGKVTRDGMVRARSELRGTFIFSSELTSSRTLETLAQSVRAGVVSLGSAGPTSLYGPTVLATRRVPDDATLLSNATTVILPWGERAYGESEARAAALTAMGLRNQLLHYQFNFIQQQELETSQIALGHDNGPWKPARALFSHPTADQAFLERAVNIASACARPAREGVPRSYRATISAVLFYFHEYAGSQIAKTNSLLSRGSSPSWIHAAKWVDYPDLRILTSLAKGALRGWGNEAALTESEVGRILADVGLAGLGPKGADFQLVFTNDIAMKLHQLARFCGVVDVGLPSYLSNEYHLCPYCREVGFVNRKFLQYYEDHELPRIREAERREAEEGARRIAKLEQADGRLGKISPTPGDQASEGTQQCTRILSPSRGLHRGRIHDPWAPEEWKEARTDGRKLSKGRSATRRSES